VVDRVSITTSRIICRDANNNITFDSNDAYLRTDTNGQFFAGGHFAVPVIYGNGGQSAIRQHDGAGGYLETTGQFPIKLHDANGNFGPPHNANTQGALPLAFDYQGSSATGFSFNLASGFTAFSNALANQSGTFTGAGFQFYTVQNQGSLIKPYQSNGTHPVVTMYKNGSAVGTVMLVARNMAFFGQFANNNSTISGFTSTIVAPQYVSGDFSAGGTFTCNFYSNPNSYNWKDAGNVNKNNYLHSVDLYWGPINTFRESAPTNLALVKTA